MKLRVRLIRARPKVYMISDNLNVSLGIDDCSLYFRQIALKDGYHKEPMEMLACFPVELNYLENLAKTFIIPARHTQFVQGNIFNSAPVRQIAIAMNTNSVFTGSYIENPFWYQQFDLRQSRTLRGDQAIVDVDAADFCRLYDFTMKTMNFQDYIPSIPIGNFEEHYVLMFNLTSMQDATENCHYPELVGEPLRMELNFTFPLEHVTEVNMLREHECFRLQLTNLVLLENTSKMNDVSLHQKINRNPQLKYLKYRYVGSFPCDYVPTLNIDSFANVNTQPSNMQGQHWILIANFRQILYFGDSLGRKAYSFLKQQYEQMMPEPLQAQPNVCSLYTI